MNEQLVKSNLVIMIETKSEIGDLNSEIKKIEERLKPEDKPLTIDELNKKMDDLEKNKSIYSDLQKRLAERIKIRKEAEKILINEIPIFGQKIVVDLGQPHGIIQLSKSKDLYGQQEPKIEYFHVIG